jgi:hypothetical protein
MSNETTKQRPTHRIYSVSKGEEGKANWTVIGAAWPHKDGQGFGLHFTAKPLDGAEIVLRAVKDQEEGAAVKAAADDSTS